MGSSDPKVIVVKQESNSDDKTASNSKGRDVKPEAPQYNNPYVYAYPPEYYYDEDDDYDDGYDDDYEDDYEE